MAKKSFCNSHFLLCPFCTHYILHVERAAGDNTLGLIAKLKQNLLVVVVTCELELRCELKNRIVF